MHPRGYFLHFTILLVLSMATRALRAEDEPPELAQARAMYQKDVEFATRPIRDRYLSKLDVLKRSLGARGDARGAAAVQDEIDRLKATITGIAAIARFVGFWALDYGSGSTRKYTIRSDGTLIMSEINGGSIVPPRTARITLRGSDLVIEFENDPSLERLSISGNKLIVEQFNPKTLYPKNPPNYRATGTKVAAGNP